MANVDIQIGYKDSAWFTNNATLILKVGQTVHLQQTGTYKIGDGTSQLQNLAFLGDEAQLITATVVNKTGVNLLAANYQAVKISTAQGQRLAIDFAQANNDNNSADTIGLINENIAINQEGSITILGQIIKINTTGSLQGETWADGDVLYLSPTVAGAITNIKPTGLTGHLVVLGYVEYAHANNGKIYTKISNGYELDELHNVYVNPTTLANNDVLTYESSSSLWKNKQVKDTMSVWFFSGSLNPADNTTYYFNSTISPTTVAASHQMSFGFNFIIKEAVVYFANNSVFGTTENNIINFRNITQSTSSTITNTAKSNASTISIVSQTINGLSINVGANDNFCFEWITPNYATNPTNTLVRVQLFFEKTL